jgi:hypothetical protein
MVFAPSSAAGSAVDVTRPMVKALFVASCLLSIVSWYTTQEGMALYLSRWFALLASLGVQSALVFVAWLIGFSRAKKGLLIAVYVVTAVVSIAFSYVSLYTWFSARERPMTIERKLYDALNAASAKTDSILSAAIAEQQKHVLALEELTGAEKTHGHISRAQDADPYLKKVRDAVAKEASTYAQSYKEGAGEGVRYTAFDRYTRLAQQSLDQMKAADKGMADFRAQEKPLDPTDKQLRDFHRAYDSIPWPGVEEALHQEHFERPEVPVYSDFVDRTASGQEDLLTAFSELFTAPTGRHIFSLLLAAFIDIIVFLLAYASGPYFFGTSEQRWVSAGASLDALDDQVFVRNFLSKMMPGFRGMARVDSSALSSGEQQLCLILAAKDLAMVREEEGRTFYLLDPGLHERMLETLSEASFPLRASAPNMPA